MRTSVPGVATGLAWTPVGGDILFIEATATPGAGRLILTGQLGDVMKGERAGRAQPSVENRAASDMASTRLVSEQDRHPRPRAGGRDAERRPERRGGDVHGARVAHDRTHRAQRHRDDRRNRSPRPRASGRRHIKEKIVAARPSRTEAHHVACTQPEGLRGYSRRGAAAIDVHMGSSGWMTRFPRRSGSERRRPKGSRPWTAWPCRRLRRFRAAAPSMLKDRRLLSPAFLRHAR